jgi:hypothetical protein
MKTLSKAVLLFIICWVVIITMFIFDLFDVLGPQSQPLVSMIIGLLITLLFSGLLNKYIQASLSTFLYTQLIFVSTLILFFYFLLKNISFLL